MQLFEKNSIFILNTFLVITLNNFFVDCSDTLFGRLCENQRLLSENGKYAAEMESTGSFTVYNVRSRQINFSVQTKKENLVEPFASGYFCLELEKNGNLMLYVIFRKESVYYAFPLWQTHTYNQEVVADRLVLDNYGILTLKSANGTKVWRSSYKKRYTIDDYKRAILKQGEIINEGESLVSPNGIYRAVLQKDGNFVLYDPCGRQIQKVDSPTIKERLNDKVRISPFYLKLKDDGDLVICNAESVVLWRTFTSSDIVKAFPPYRLILHDNGDLILYARKNIIWSWTNEFKNVDYGK